ncbi:MAG: DUF3108 domain-containing protein [Calditrichaceae bacterium]|nr:DUF3108 domain-containing protein [Calditrichia bacterium]NUQ41448.1 DUF3108 domain-containing protein [Calditrichaceae bacterium]
MKWFRILIFITAGSIALGSTAAVLMVPWCFPAPALAQQDSSGVDSLQPGAAEADSLKKEPGDSLEAAQQGASTFPGNDTLAKTLSENRPLNKLDRVISNNAFRPGEKLTFTVRWKFIKAGEATMEVRDIVNLRDGVTAYHIVSTAHSAKFFDAFYRVRDQVETFLDTRGIFSWKYNKRLREGGYKFDLLVDYDQANGVAQIERIRYESDEPLKVRNQEKFELDIPEYVLDVLSAFYYVRTQELKIGEPIYMANHDNRQVYQLQVIIQRKERVKVDAGTFDCIMVQPRLLGEAIFKQKGELWVWLTDDEYKIPVQMKSAVAVGSITTELKKIEGVPNPIPARVK